MPLPNWSPLFAAATILLLPLFVPRAFLAIALVVGGIVTWLGREAPKSTDGGLAPTAGSSGEEGQPRVGMARIGEWHQREMTCFCHLIV